MCARFGCVACICPLLIVPMLWADDVEWGPARVGVVCLDQATGVPLWEYFPHELEDSTFRRDGVDLVFIRLPYGKYLEDFTLRSDGIDLFFIRGQYGKYVDDPTPETRAALSVTRIDPDTGREFVGPAPPPPLPPPDRLKPARAASQNLVTASGDRVVGGWNTRSITIMKGESDEPRSVISLEHTPWALMVYRNVIIYVHSPSHNIPIGEPSVTAVNANTLARVWAIEDGKRILGIRLIEDRLYVCTLEQIRVVNADTGQLIWRQRLPRLRNRARAYEHDALVFVTCGYLPRDHPPWYLYCLDGDTGEIHWGYDAGDLPHGCPLLFHDKKVYARIPPTKLMSSWRLNSRERGFFNISRYIDRWASPTDRQLVEGFAFKAQDEIELNLRAWHVLGDRSAIALLYSAQRLLEEGALRNVPGELIATFPIRRQPMALIEFLEEQFESRPDLRTEVGRILDDFNPIPYWYEHERCARREPCPKFSLSPEERALIDNYRMLKARTDVVPVTRITREALVELILNDRLAEFDVLVAAHNATTKPDDRMLTRMALYAQHPVAASDWALQHLDEISPAEIAQWVQRVPVEWLLAHEDLYLSWLLHDDGSVQSFSMRTLGRLDDRSLAVPICARVIKASLDGHPPSEPWMEILALEVLGEHGESEHIPLVRRFLEGESSAEPDSPQLSTEQPYHRSDALRAAAQALEAIEGRARGESLDLQPP